MPQIIKKRKRSGSLRKQNPLFMFFFVALLAGVTFSVANSEFLLNYLSRAGVGSNTNIVFVNQDGNPILETKSAFVNVKLTSPWGIAGNSTDVKAVQSATYQIQSSADDVNQDGNNLSTSERDFWIGTGQSRTVSYTGLRFTNVTIPKGSKITSARLQVFNVQQQWQNIRFEMYADNSGNSTAFSNSNKPSNRSLTSNRVTHRSNVRWNANNWYTLNEMAPIVQEIINRNDWQSGNSVSIIFKGTGSSWGRKFVNSFDRNQSNAPKLLISYEPASGTTITQAQPTATPTKVIPTNTPVPPTATPTVTVTTSFVELAEDAGFTKNYVKAPYVSHPLQATFTFEDATPGKKTLYARFTASNGQTQVYSNWIDLIALPTVTPTPTTPPTGGHDGHGENSHAMGRWSPNPKYDTCTVTEHDSYKVMGPDGKWYPTWHPPVHSRADGTTCTFGHEHGRSPEGSQLLTFLKEQYGYDADKNGKVEGNELTTAGVPFGYVNEQLDIYNTSKGITNGMRHEDHVGHKIEWENDIQRDWSTINGGSGRIPSGIYCDFFMKVHQGTHSKDAFTNNMHELIQAYECTDGIKMANAQMLLFGRPGGFVKGTVAGGFEFVPVGTAVPENSPSGGNAPGRVIPEIEKVKEHILKPAGQWSMYSEGIYEDWISGNYVELPNGTDIAYFDPHFAVFSPSRFFWPGTDANTHGIMRTQQDKADNVGRSIDLCYMYETNGDRARGGECTWMGELSPKIAYDDPRSSFNGVKREFYFNNMGVFNTGGNTIWYTDPFGKNAQTSPFIGSVKHYLKPKNDPTPYQYPFESNAIGGDRWYGGNGVHAPN